MLRWPCCFLASHTHLSLFYSNHCNLRRRLSLVARMLGQSRLVWTSEDARPDLNFSVKRGSAAQHREQMQHAATLQDVKYTYEQSLERLVREAALVCLQNPGVRELDSLVNALLQMSEQAGEYQQALVHGIPAAPLSSRFMDSQLDQSVSFAREECGPCAAGSAADAQSVGRWLAARVQRQAAAAQAFARERLRSSAVVPASRKRSRS